jgi:hypothetical protein
MPLDIGKITAALNAYPWTSGTLTMRDGGSALYCALGLLLRYAGVPQPEIERAGPSQVVLDRYRALLEAEYGITELATIDNIIQANDSASSQAEAIEQVQFVLEGGNIAERLRARHAAAKALDAEARRNLEDDGSGCGALVG